MFRPDLIAITLLAVLLCPGLVPAQADRPARAAAYERMEAVTGESSLTDPYQAGLEAATIAKEDLFSTQPMLVLVTDNLETTQTGKEAMLEGIGQVFPRELIFGCSSFGPITDQGNMGAVGVLALAGPIELRTALAEGEQREAGRQIAQALIEGAGDLDPRRLLIVLGNCHIPANATLIEGIREIDNDPAALRIPYIVGGSSPMQGFQYYEGKVVQESNMGLLLAGPIGVGLSLMEAPDVEGIIKTAGYAVGEAIQSGPGRPVLELVFDCAGRMGQLGEARAREFKAMQSGQMAGSALFGFYGSGEIGHASPDDPCQGVGLHVAVCALSPRYSMAW